MLKGTVELNSGIQLAAWYNNCDTVTVRSDHHTLSLYVADGYESYQKDAARLEKWRRPGPFLSDAERR
ncbi:Transcriptional regulator, AraC family [Klebsiella pneumoniae IS53]|nr:Transcriptional regulator, AraC family [Klebsiella pneumoniae IS53]